MTPFQFNKLVILNISNIQKNSNSLHVFSLQIHEYAKYQNRMGDFERFSHNFEKKKTSKGMWMLTVVQF